MELIPKDELKLLLWLCENHNKEKNKDKIKIVDFIIKNNTPVYYFSEESLMFFIVYIDFPSVKEVPVQLSIKGNQCNIQGVEHGCSVQGTINFLDKAIVPKCAC